MRSSSPERTQRPVIILSAPDRRRVKAGFRSLLLALGLVTPWLAHAASAAPRLVPDAVAPDLGGPFKAVDERLVESTSGAKPRLQNLRFAQLPGAASDATAVRDSRTAPGVPPADDVVPLEMRDPARGKSNVWYLQTSVYTHHFHADPAHLNHQRLVDIEYWRDDGWLGGFAMFRNSFGQPTQYLFVGKRWRPLDSLPGAYLRVTGGLLHGYKGEYRDRIPFNSRGVAPVILPGIGYSGRRFASELVFFGTNGLMLTVGVFLY